MYGKPKNLCDSLYWTVQFVAVVWSETDLTASPRCTCNDKGKLNQQQKKASPSLHIQDLSPLLVQLRLFGFARGLIGWETRLEVPRSVPLVWPSGLTCAIVSCYGCGRGGSPFVLSWLLVLKQLLQSGAPVCL